MYHDARRPQIPLPATLSVLVLTMLLAAAFPAVAGTVCGNVTDRETGAPIAQAAVLLCDASGTPLGPLATTAADGSFCLDGVPPGTYTLAVRVDDYLVAWVRGVEVADGVGSVPITGTLPPFSVGAPWPNPASADVNFSLVLNRRIPLRVTVHDLRGRLVRAWTATAAEPGSRVYRWDGCDATGRPVSSGSYLLRIETRGFSVERNLLLTR